MILTAVAARAGAGQYAFSTSGRRRRRQHRCRRDHRCMVPPRPPSFWSRARARLGWGCSGSTARSRGARPRGVLTPVGAPSRHSPSASVSTVGRWRGGHPSRVRPSSTPLRSACVAKPFLQACWRPLSVSMTSPTGPEQRRPCGLPPAWACPSSTVSTCWSAQAALSSRAMDGCATLDSGDGTSRPVGLNRHPSPSSGRSALPTLQRVGSHRTRVLRGPNEGRDVAVDGDHIGLMLLEEGIVDRAGLDSALAISAEHGEPLTRVLVDEGIVDEAQLVQVLAASIGIEFVSLADVNIDPAAAAALVPETLARRYSVIPIGFEDERLVVAMADPGNVLIVDDVRAITGLQITAKGRHPGRHRRGTAENGPLRRFGRRIRRHGESRRGTRGSVETSRRPSKRPLSSSS